jgi:hypothetical protein
MSRRTQLWIASIFTLTNVGGGIYAGVQGEAVHTLVHVVLTIAGGYWLSRLVRPVPAQQSLGDSLPEARLERLQHSVEAVAIELERVGEAQRHINELEQERAQKERAR